MTVEEHQRSLQENLSTLFPSEVDSAADLRFHFVCCGVLREHRVTKIGQCQALTLLQPFHFFFLRIAKQKCMENK
jgi:hypothetical protein